MTDVAKYVKEFTLTTSSGETIEIPLMIKTYHALAKFILRTYLEQYDYSFSHESRVQFMLDVIESQDTKFSLSTCVDPLSLAIISNYTIFKKNGTLPLSTRDNKQLSYIIKKMFENSIQKSK